MYPPQDAGRRCSGGNGERGQIRHHQCKNQQGDKTGTPGELLSKPAGPQQKAADEKAQNSDGTGEGKKTCKVVVEAAKSSSGVKEWNAQPNGEVVEGDDYKSAEPPENKGMSNAGQRPLANHFGLAKNLPQKVPDTLADGEEVEVRVLFRGQNLVEDGAEPLPEHRTRGENQRGKKQLLPEGEVLGLSQRKGEQNHSRTTQHNTRLAVG